MTPADLVESEVWRLWVNRKSSGVSLENRLPAQGPIWPAVTTRSCISPLWWALRLKSCQEWAAGGAGRTA